MRHHPWTNRIVLAVLRSPVHRLFSGSLCELSYQTRDGRAVRLPVLYATRGDELIVIAAGAAGKRWWRAFNHPHPVTVRQAGRVWAGLARTIHPDHPSSRILRETYARRFRYAPASADRIVLIEPVRTAEEKPCTSSPGLRSPRPS